MSWWPADGNADDTRGSQGGVLHNGAGHATGEAGQAFRLDGVDDYVGDIGALPTYAFIQNTGLFTISAWIQLDNPSALVEQAITANTGTTIEKGHLRREREHDWGRDPHLPVQPGGPPGDGGLRGDGDLHL